MSPNIYDLIDLIRDHRVFIQTHNFPDQDAIASAYGLQVVLEKYGIETTICHFGRVERAVTANMVAKFGIKMTSDNDKDYMVEDDYIIIVDSQKGNRNIRDFIGNEVACIDHHPVFSEKDDYKYKDIRMVGSCATIIADYYRQNNVEMPESVATALLYGLKCDTRDFTRGVTQLDVDIYNYLFSKADHQIIRHFQAASIQYNELNAFAESMKNIDIIGGVSFSYLDFECEEGFIATVSDFILDIDEVYVAVVYDRREDGFKISIRSEFDEMDAGQIISEALNGVGSGGGHKTMAGGFAQKSEIMKLGDDFRRVIRNLFMKVINKIPRSEMSAKVMPILTDEEINA